MKCNVLLIVYNIQLSHLLSILNGVVIVIEIKVDNLIMTFQLLRARLINITFKGQELFKRKYNTKIIFYLIITFTHYYQLAIKKFLHVL
jgi:hypothetical protein